MTDTISNAYPSYVPATDWDLREFRDLRFDFAQLCKANREAGIEPPVFDEFAVEHGWSWVDSVLIPMRVGRGDKVHIGHASAWVAPGGAWVIVGGRVWCGSRRWGSGEYAVFNGRPLERRDERITCRKCGG